MAHLLSKFTYGFVIADKDHMMQIATPCTEPSDNPTAQIAPQGQAHIDAYQYIDDANGLEFVIEPEDQRKDPEDHTHHNHRGEDIAQNGASTIGTVEKGDRTQLDTNHIGDCEQRGHKPELERDIKQVLTARAKDALVKIIEYQIDD
jgi:hypothetical protein